MSCRVQRVNGQISKVFLENGKESQLYPELAKAAEDMPDEYRSYVNLSLRPYVEKYIKDSSNPAEVALGLYMQTHTTDFKRWFGNWEKDPESVKGRVNDLGEPKVFIEDGQPSFKGPREVDSRSVFNNGTVTQSYRDEYRSIGTKRREDLLSSVQKTDDVLRDHYREALEKKTMIKNTDELTREQKIERNRYYDGILSNLDKQRQELKQKNTLDAVFVQANTDLEMAGKMLNGVKLSISDANFGERVTNFWSRLGDMDGLLDSEDPKIHTALENITGKAETLQRKFTNMSKKILMKQSMEELGTENAIKSKDFDATRDMNIVSSLTRDASTTQSPLVSLGAKHIVETNIAVKRERNDNRGKIQAAYDKIKSHPAANGKDAYKVFFHETKDKEGNVLDRKLRVPFSPEYSSLLALKNTELQRKLGNAGIDKNAVRKAYNDHNDWIKANTIAFDARPFIETDANGNLVHPDSAREVVTNKMIAEGFTKQEVAHMAQEAKARYDKYKEDGENFRTTLEAGILHGDVLVPHEADQDKWVDEKVKEWSEIHDPIAHQSFLNNDQPYNTAYRGYEYGISYPRRVINGKDTGYYDPEFQKIASDPKLLEFYHFFKDTIAEHLTSLPEELTSKLGSNFLPVVGDQIARDLALNGVKGGLNGIDNWMMKLLTTNEYDKAIDPISGKERPTLKPRFVDETRTPIGERSSDMVVMLQAFSDMASMYKHKIGIKDEIDVINNMVQDMSGTIKTDKLGNDKRIEKAPSNIQRLFESTVLHSFYGVGREAEGLSKRSFYNTAELLTLGMYKSKEYFKGKELEKNINDLNYSLENDKLSSEERQDKEQLLTQFKQDYKDLGGRQFAVSKAADAIVKSTRFTTMALNPFSAFRSFAFGEIANRVHGYGGLDYTSKDINKAAYLMKDSSAKFLTWGTAKSEFTEKLLRVTLDAGVVESRDPMFKGGTITKGSSLEQMKKVLPSPFALISGGHYFFKAELGLAMMLGNKVKTASGDVMLLDGLNKDLTWNEGKYGKFDAAANGAKDFEDYYKGFLNKYGQVAKTLHGFFGDNLNIAGKDTTIGRMLFLFKSFLPETIATRFERNRYDPLLQRNTEGFYRTFARELLNHPVEGLKMIWDAVANNEAGKAMDRLTQSNLRKFFAEAATISSMAMMYMMLKAVGPNKDDDQDYRKRYNLLVNQLFLVNRNLTYYMNPSSFKDLTQNVFPVLQTIDNYQQALKGVAYYGYGVATGQSDQPMYDGDKTFKKVSKALPVLNNYNRIINYQRSTMETGK